jgi:hypothetical protein
MDEQEKLRIAVSNVLCNASNFPDGVGVRVLGRDMRPLIEKVMDAVIAAGFTASEDEARMLQWRADWDAVNSLPHWYDPEREYGEYDLQPLGPDDTSEHGAFMLVRAAMLESRKDVRA